MNKTVMWATHYHLKYFLNSSRVLYRGLFRSYYIFIAMVIFLAIAYVVPALTINRIVDTSVSDSRAFYLNESGEYRFPIENRVWAIDRLIFLILGFSGTLTSLGCVIPILLIVNRLFLNPLKNGQFLLYISTPVKKSTNLTAVIVNSILVVFVYIIISEVGKTLISINLIKDIMKEKALVPESEIIVSHMESALPYSVLYTLIFSIIIILFSIIVGINFSRITASIITYTFFVVTTTLYIGIQIGLVNISDIGEKAAWVNKIVAILFVGAYPSFINLHSYINGGYLELSNEFATNDRVFYSYSYIRPYMQNVLKNEGDIESLLFIQENELLIVMGVLIVILLGTIIFLWRKKQIL